MAQSTRNKGSWRRRPLHWNILLLILFCWALPVLLTVLVSGMLAVRSANERAADFVSVAVAGALDSARQVLDNVVADSISASYIPTIRDAYGGYRTNGDKVQLHTVCRDFLHQHYSRNPNIAAAYLLFPEMEDSVYDRCYAFNTDVSAAPQALSFYTMGASEQALALRDSLDTQIGFFFHNGNLYTVRNLSLQSGRMQPYALLVMRVNQSQLFSGLRGLPWIREASCSVNEISLAPAIRASGAFPGTDVVSGGEGYLIQGDVTGNRYTLSYSVEADLTPLTGKLDSQVWVVGAIAVFEMLLMILALLYLQRQVSRPVQQLSALAWRIEQGEFGAQTSADTLPNMEFHYLGAHMNRMSAQLEQQFERQYREELALRDARIKALQSQINPHFLGNTLEVIGWEARLAGNVKVVQMLEAMTTILRATQDRDQRPLVHLSEEMTYVNAYLTITRERLGKRLTVVIDMVPDLLDWYVPRLILQPIVENAIEHSVRKRPRGEVIIRAIAIDSDWMRLEVENDAPLSDEHAERIADLLGGEGSGETREKSGNIGIRNVHQRLRILYGEQSGLVIGNNGQGHTVSSMCIQKLNIEQINTTKGKSIHGNEDSGALS